MLRELKISNFAIVSQLDIHFQPGLNVMTGETGAGKSIIIDAIGAVTGARTSRDMLRSGAEHATVSAVFDETDDAALWCKENDIDPFESDTADGRPDSGGSLVLQRRITADGRSSCRVNGMPVSVSQLHTLGAALLEIHGQNDGLRLLDERMHLSALDRYCGLAADDYRESYHLLRKLEKERERLNLDEEEKQRLTDSLQYTIRELEQLNIQSGETEELRSRRELLRNAEKLTEALECANQALDGENGAIGSAQDASWHCRKASDFAPELREAAEKLEQASFLLSDAHEILRDFENELSFSPDEYDRLEQRLKEIGRLERKYRRSADELPDYLDECRKRLDEIAFAEEALEKLDKQISAQEKRCIREAEQLHLLRQDASVKLAEAVEEELHALSMPYARFRVETVRLEELSENGLSAVRFLISANPGEEPGRISRIASGGELSRIMLAMKNVLSASDRIPTLVFDEIDTGVSGIAAQRVGEKLAMLSNRKQVLCVTHLPQIAVLADLHFVIRKTEADGRTHTDVQELDHIGQCREIARLHGGEHITETTLRSAEEQLMNAEQYKKTLFPADQGKESKQ